MALKDTLAKINAGELKVSNKLGQAAGGGGNGGGWGNLGGLLDMVKEAPGGLIGFAGEVDRGLTNLLGGITAIPRGVAEKAGAGNGVAEFFGNMAMAQIPGGAAAKGAIDLKKRDEGGLSGIQDRMLTNDPNLSLMQNIDAKMNREVPALVALPKGVAESGKTTAQNVSAVASGNPGDAPYAKAWGEGDLFPLLINDVGNLAAVGELGAGVLTRASRAATKAETAAQVAAGDFSRLPAPPAAQTVNAAVNVADAAKTAAAADDALRTNPVFAEAEQIFNSTNDPVIRRAAASKMADMRAAAQPADFSHLPPPPTVAAAQATRAPFVAAPGEGFIGRTLGPYAPQLRAAADATGSGVDFANRIAGAPFLPFQYAAQGLIAGAARYAPETVAQIRQGVSGYQQTLAENSVLQGQQSAMGHGFMADAQALHEWATKNLSRSEYDAAVMDRDGWANPDRVAQVEKVVEAKKALGVEDPYEGLPYQLNDETLGVLKDLSAARASGEPSGFLSRMDEARVRLQSGMGEGGLQDIQDMRVATGVGRKSDYNPETLWEQTYGNAPVEARVQDRLAADRQYQAAKKIVDDYEASGATGADPAVVAKAREDLARIEEAAAAPTPRGVAEATGAGPEGVDLYENVIRPNLPRQPLQVDEQGVVPGSPVEAVVPGAEVRYTAPADGMPAQVEVWAPDGGDMNPVGAFTWDPVTGEIDTVVTHPMMQRQGIGSALYETADRIADDLGISRPVHSSNLTPEGRAFAESVTRREAAQAAEALRAQVDEVGKVAPEPVEAARAKLAERERLAREHPDTAPPEWRSSMQWNATLQKAGNELADDLAAAGYEDLARTLREQSDQMPLTIDQMLDAGYARPQHVYASSNSDRSAGAGRSKGPRLKKTGAENMRDSGPVMDYSPEKYLSEMMFAHAEQNLNEAVRARMAPYMDAPPAELASVLESTTDPALVTREMARAGYEPYDTRSLGRQEQASAVDLTGDRTVWVPKGVGKGWEAAMAAHTREMNELWRAYDKGISGYKTLLLPLNPRWNVGNLGGNTILASTAPTVRLRDLANPELWKTTWRNMKNPDEVTAQVLKRGPAESALGDSLGADVLNTGGKVRRGYRKVVQGSYQLNNTIDDFAHTFVLTAGRERSAARIGELKGLLDEGSITKEQFDRLSQPPKNVRGGGDKPYTDEQLVHIANSYVGDFTNLTPLERNGIKRLVIFYPWLRHITQLAFRLPVQNPYRVAWTLNLADMYKDDEYKPEWLKGSIPLGGGDFLRMGGINPFGSAVGDDSPAFSPAAALGAMSPAVQWPLGAWNITGRGTVNPDQDKPGFIGLESLAGYALNQTPMSRLVADTVQGPYARYQDRSPVMSRGRPIENNVLGGRWAAPMNWLTGLSIAQVDLEAEKAKETRKKRQQERGR